MVRLKVIYTRTGDAGQSGLGDGTRRPKTDARFAAMGDVDETNCAVGLARLHTGGADDPALAAIEATLARVQNDLFDLGADLCMPPAEGQAPSCGEILPGYGDEPSVGGTEASGSRGLRVPYEIRYTMCISRAIPGDKEIAMPTTKETISPPITRPVNLRVREDVRDLIDRAARVNGKTRSDFMIEAARQAAENALLDQTFVRVDAETYTQFLSVLDRPPSGDGYERLMRAPKPWKA